MAKVTQPGRNSIPARTPDVSGKKEKRHFTLPPSPARDQLDAEGLKGEAAINPRRSISARSVAPAAAPPADLPADQAAVMDRKIQRAIRDQVATLFTQWRSDDSGRDKSLAPMQGFVDFSRTRSSDFDALSTLLGMSFSIVNPYHGKDQKLVFQTDALQRLNPPEAGRALLEEMGEFVDSCMNGRSRLSDLDMILDFCAAFGRLDFQNRSSRAGETADSPLREAHAWVSPMLAVIDAIQDALVMVEQDELDAQRDQHSLLNPANFDRQLDQAAQADPDPDFDDWDYVAEDSDTESAESSGSEIESPISTPAFSKKLPIDQDD